MPTEPAERYDLRVPRYTSYPTALHFGPAIDGERYRDWLGELDPATPLSLYVHIPFCDEMCWFCGCYTKIVNRYEPIRSYLSALHREIALVADALPKRFTVRHLHVGGGSPTMLAPEDWLALTRLLRRRFDFAPDAEIAVELDPRDATEEYVAALAAAGVNRASIGVQDFDPDVQREINRLQPFAGGRARHRLAAPARPRTGQPRPDVRTAAADRGEGVGDGRSRRAPGAVARGAVRLCARAVDEGAPETDRRDAPARPGRAVAAVLAASRRLRDGGFVAIGLDHFARPTDDLAAALEGGRLRRNFQGYTADDAPILLGLGASAIGTLPRGYVQNASPLADYAAPSTTAGCRPRAAWRSPPTTGCGATSSNG